MLDVSAPEAVSLDPQASLHGGDLDTTGLAHPLLFPVACSALQWVHGGHCAHRWDPSLGGFGEIVLSSHVKRALGFGSPDRKSWNAAMVSVTTIGKVRGNVLQEGKLSVLACFHLSPFLLFVVVCLFCSFGPKLGSASRCRCFVGP